MQIKTFMSIFFKGRRPAGTAKNRLLDRALVAWHEAETGNEQLSSEARTAIRRAVLDARDASAPMATLFTPTRRLAVAGALPIAVTAAILLAAGDRAGREAPVDGLEIAKQGDRVVFSVEEGATVTRSTVPFRFDPAAGVQVADGTFSEEATSGPRLVFYKIE